MSRRLLGFPVSFLASLALTGGLFWFLHTRLDQPVKVVHTAPPVRIEFTRAIHDTAVQSRRDEKPILERAPTLPQFAPIAEPGGAGDGTRLADFENPPAGRVVPPPFEPRGPGPGPDSDVMPIVRIEPEYPARAAQLGIEGWVVVQFTVTPIGTVANAGVVESSPKGFFEDAALRAVRRWKYKPRVMDGTAVERRGLQVRLVFELEKH